MASRKLSRNYLRNTLVEPKEGILPKKTKGIQAIQKKAELFISMVEQSMAPL